MTVRWVTTTVEVYREIYRQHMGQFQVFATISDDGEYNGEKRIMTEWGFKNADEPLIKSDLRGGTWSYYIASVSKEEE